MTDRFHRACERFKLFFEEVDEAFVEREDVVAQMALALLGKQHVLLTGPPGTAKSKLAKSVLARIVDESTGKPSLFSCQFTENTVHTDLVGAVDFKTLTETGRTEHFVDEGIAGAVHAFLDEVFDARDMLLRATLGLLHEREVKQGLKSTQGKIEVAVMTTNRYLSEALEESRQSLLAFVDRVAYLSFVPKGFAKAESLQKVMRAQLVEAQRPLHEVLTLQDVDALQAAVEAVYFAPQLSDRLATFLRSFEDEVGRTVRADPEYTPTRYMSTRTMVRAAEALRAIVVYDRIFSERGRPLEVLPKDFEKLRLLLLLSGPSRDQLSELLERQDDQREKRQLQIIATERDVFEACLARLDRSEPKRKETRTRPLDDATLRKSTIEELVELVARLGASTATQPNELERVLRQLGHKVVEEGLVASTLGESEGTFERLSGSLRALERRGVCRELTPWLRTRAVKAVDAMIAKRGVPGEDSLATPGARGLDVVRPLLLERLDDIERLFELRRELAVFADEHGESAQLAALEWIQRDVTHQAERAFLVDAREARHGDHVSLESLGALRSSFDALKALEARANQVLGADTRLLERLVAPKLSLLVELALAALERVDRNEVLEHLEGVLALVLDVGLLPHLPEAPVLAAALSAMVRQERAMLRSEEPAPSELGIEAYRELRNRVPKVALSYLAARMCLRLDPGDSPSGDETRVIEDLNRRLEALPEDVRSGVVELDRDRLERPIAFLERWWASVEAISDVEARRARVRESRLLEALRDESALERFRLELGLLGDLLSEARGAVDELMPRIASLQKVLGRIGELEGSALAREWHALVGGS